MVRVCITIYKKEIEDNFYRLRVNSPFPLLLKQDVQMIYAFRFKKKKAKVIFTDYEQIFLSLCYLNRMYK